MARVTGINEHMHSKHPTLPPKKINHLAKYDVELLEIFQKCFGKIWPKDEEKNESMSTSPITTAKDSNSNGKSKHSTLHLTVTDKILCSLCNFLKAS